MNTTASDTRQENDQIVTRDPLPSTPPRSAAEAETRRLLETDFEALREREANLRRYEARLRGWQEQLDARSGNSGGAPEGAIFGNSTPEADASSDAELCAAWDKFHRARALLQAEQNQARDDRMAQHDNLLDLERREADLAAREKRLAERELMLTIAVGGQGEKKESQMKRFTQPFMAAKAVFSSGK